MLPITLALNVIGGCQCYGSRGWAFLLTSHCILLPYHKWKQRVSPTEHTECVWSKRCVNEFLDAEKWQSLTSINVCRTSMETKQWMWAERGIAAVETEGHLYCCRILWCVARRLMFIAGQNVQLMVVTMLKSGVFNWEFTLTNSATVLFVSAVDTWK